MSPTRAAAYERLIDAWSLAETGPVLDLAEVFGRRAPVVLEIGFGGGEATLALARSRPDIDIVAVDVHTPGVGRVTVPTAVPSAVCTTTLSPALKGGVLERAGGETVSVSGGSTTRSGSRKLTTLPTALNLTLTNGR